MARALPTVPGMGRVSTTQTQLSGFSKFPTVQYTIQSIRTHAYIDFAKILHDNNEDGTEECEETELQTQGSSGIQCVVRHKKVKAQAIDGIIKWIRASSIWVFTFLDTHPGEGKGLFQHLH